MSTFKVGDVVQLRSGGPLSTVNNVGSVGIQCMYFNTISGTFDLFSCNEAVLRIAVDRPVAPDDQKTMRNTGIAKSSLS